MLTRICNRCGIEKCLESDFHKASDAKTGRRSICKECTKRRLREAYRSNPEKNRQRASEWKKANRDRTNSMNRRYRANNPEWTRRYRRKYKLKYDYGMTESDFVAMCEKQDGFCANPGCREPLRDIDHDHKTGKVRGILCPGCNKSLGMMRDDVVRIRGLADYVEMHV